MTDEKKFAAGRIVELVCPECSTELIGLPVDRVFICGKCGTATDFWESPPGITKCQFVKNNSPQNDFVVYLPAFVYGLSVNVSAVDEEVEDKARSAIPERLWVFGCIFQRPRVHGDFNIEITCLNPEYDLSGKPATVYGCQLRRVHAEGLVIPLTESVIDRAQDITNVQIDVAVNSWELHALPFTLNDTHLVCKEVNLSISRSALVINPWINKLRYDEYLV